MSMTCPDQCLAYYNPFSFGNSNFCISIITNVVIADNTMLFKLCPFDSSAGIAEDYSKLFLSSMS